MPRTVPRPFHVMAKPTGAICNLDCEYCFYLSKEGLYPGSGFRMDDGVLERYVEGLLDAHHGAEEVVVAFQGGEPTLMGLDFFERVVALERRWARPGQLVVNTLQTNGTLIDDRWAAFLARERFLVGVSIDGPRPLHDAYRTDKAGRPTFDRVVRGIEALRRHGVEWNALTTVNAANAAHGLEVYRFLRDGLEARFIQLIPVVEPEAAGVSPRTVTAEDYGAFLVAVFDEWVRRDVGTVFVPSFDTALAHWLGLRDVGSCVQAETCGRSVALEHNGDVYACDHFVDPEHRIGNLADGRSLLQIIDSGPQLAFGAAKRDSLPRRCRQCEVLFACNGGCPKDRILPADDGLSRLNHLCAGYLAFFRHIDPPMRVMADLVRRGGFADGVMDWLAEQDAAGAGAGPSPDRSGDPSGSHHDLSAAHSAVGAAADPPLSTQEFPS